MLSHRASPGPKGHEPALPALRLRRGPTNRAAFRREQNRVNLGRKDSSYSLTTRLTEEA